MAPRKKASPAPETEEPKVEEPKVENPVEETPAVQAEVITVNPKDLPESSVSASVALKSRLGLDIMFTIREGANIEMAKGILDVMGESIIYAKERWNLSATNEELPQPAPSPAQPAPAPAPVPMPAQQPAPSPAPTAPPVQEPTYGAPGISGSTFETTSLISEVKSNGKRYWKVKGGPYTQYGVRIWDEVLEEAGFDVAMMDQPAYQLIGYLAHCEFDQSGKPKKVIRLEAPTN